MTSKELMFGLHQCLFCFYGESSPRGPLDIYFGSRKWLPIQCQVVPKLSSTHELIVSSDKCCAIWGGLRSSDPVDQIQGRDE
jgi:hypothetical protein